MKKGIIFDVDGTLWDACDVVADSWNEYLERYAPDVKVHVTGEDMHRLMGRTMEEIGIALFGMLPARRREEILDGSCEYEVEYLKTRGGVPYPKLRETFEKLSVKYGGEYHLYIVSNCQSGYIEDFIAWNHLEDLVEDLECFGDTKQSKGWNIRDLTERNRLDAAIYVGDTQGDYNSTREAGLSFIHARYGFGKVEEEVPSIMSLEELPELAGKVLA